MSNGSCLCESVSFSVAVTQTKLYQCFCSLCRKATGTQSNAAFIVADKHFTWNSETSFISSYQKATGFRSDFCSKCGSPVPNILRNRPYYWVPAGLMEHGFQASFTKQIFIADLAEWTVTSTSKHFTMPIMDDFIDELASSDNEAGN